MAKKQYRESQRVLPIGYAGIEKCRKIIQDHQYTKINEVMVDAFTASAICTVYDAISPENRDKLLKMPVGRTAEICFSLLK